jgi:flagellar capping protein FliD
MDTTEGIMEERITRLRAHLRNIDRYQSLLRTKLSDAEQRYLESRLSEERFAITTLNFTSSEIKTFDRPETPNQTETPQ